MQAAPNLALQGGLGLMMWGAHHRILTDYVRPGRGCAWTVLDYRRDGRSDGDSMLAEAGACVDAGPLRLGAGIGYDRSNSDLSLGGRQKLEGWHGVAEADLRLGQSGAVMSATAIYGVWNVDLRRNYLNGANTDTSTGSTDARGLALRARLDWFDIVGSGRFGLTPTISYTWSRVTVDGYTETGGGFPVTVGRSNDEASEGRLGLTGRFALAEPTTLRLRGEYIHRFDRFDAGPAFQIIGTGMGGAGGLYAVDRDHARLGADIDQRIGRSAVLSLSAHKAVGNAGGNPFSVSASFHFGF